MEQHAPAYLRPYPATPVVLRPTRNSSVINVRYEITVAGRKWCWERELPSSVGSIIWSQEGDLWGRVKGSRRVQVEFSEVVHVPTGEERREVRRTRNSGKFNVSRKVIGVSWPLWLYDLIRYLLIGRDPAQRSGQSPGPSCWG